MAKIAPPVNESPGTRGLPTWAAAGLLALAALLAYANTFSVPLILDDWVTIRDNPQLRHLSPIWEVFRPSEATGVGGRPVANLSFVLNYAFTHGSLAGYHLVNLGIHIAAGLALFGVIRRTLRGPALGPRFGADASWLAALLAALWLLHPVQTESVTYISQRTEELMGCFYFTALYCFVRTIEVPSLRWASLAVLCCGAGMSSKEGMVTFPVVALLYDYAFVSRSFVTAIRRRWPLYLGFAGWWILLFALMAGLHGRGVGFGLGTSPVQYALTECRAIATYFRLGVWPGHLVFDYGTDLPSSALGTVGSVLVVALLVAFALVGLWRWPAAGFLGAWFLITLAPTSSIVPIPLQPMAENRVYLPIAAVTTALGLVIYAAGPRRALWALAGLALAAVVTTHARNHDYRSDVAIWADTAAKMPRSSRAHGNLAQALQQAGRLAEAKAEYETALRLKPDYADGHANLASVWGMQGQNEEAAAEAQKALQIDPRHANALYNLGIARIHLGHPAEAVQALQACLAVQPNNVGAHSWLALALLQVNRPAEAYAEAQAALRLDPTSLEAFFRAAIALTQLGRMADAIPALETVVRAQPNNAEAWYVYGTALMQTGRNTEALSALQQAVRLNPGLAQAHANLGVALAGSNHLPEALAEFEAAARLDPNLTVARENIEKIRAELAHRTNAPH